MILKLYIAELNSSYILITNSNMLVRFVHNMFVNLIGNYNCVPFLREIGDKLQLVQRKNFAYWIVRCINDNAFSFAVEKAFHLFFVKYPIGRSDSVRNNFLYV